MMQPLRNFEVEFASKSCGDPNRDVDRMICKCDADYKERDVNALDCSTRPHGHLLASSSEGLVFWR